MSLVIKKGDLFKERSLGTQCSSSFIQKLSMVLSERYTAESYLDERLRQIGLK